MRKKNDNLRRDLRERVETGMKRAHNFARARTFERSQKSLKLLRESFESLAADLQYAQETGEPYNPLKHNRQMESQDDD